MSFLSTLLMQRKLEQKKKGLSTKAFWSRSVQEIISIHTPRNMLEYRFKQAGLLEVYLIYLSSEQRLQVNKIQYDIPQDPRLALRRRIKAAKQI